MADEQADTTEKRSPGRPKGSKTRRKVEREPLHQGHQRMPRHLTEDDVLSCKPVELYTHHDPLSFPLEILWQMENEYGYGGEWAARENCGMPVKNVTIRLSQGFQHATRDSFQGLLKPYVPNRPGPITEGGLDFLVAPISVIRRLKQLGDREAKAAVENMRRSHRDEGISGVTMPEGNSPVARAKNRHRTDYEPGPKIPE
jgi:hypothetical protein